jgi:hypothetical protein
MLAAFVTFHLLRTIAFDFYSLSLSLSLSLPSSLPPARQLLRSFFLFTIAFVYREAIQKAASEHYL